MDAMTINKNQDRFNKIDLEDYKSILIPNLDTEALKDQERRFNEDYRRYRDLTALTILIEIKKELIKRRNIEIKDIS